MSDKIDVTGKTWAIVVLTTSESKRLIAKAIKELPEVKAALNNGRLIIIGGTTNAFVVEELLGREINKFWFAAGRIAFGELGANEREKRIKPFVLKDGNPVDIHPNDMLMEFTSEDVYIKGANAVDPDGNAGVLVADDKGGTIGAALGIIQARGSSLIVPAGLEKLVPSVIEASKKCGQGRFQYATGLKVGLMPLVSARVVTEIHAIDILFGSDGVKATHVSSGGIAGSEGAVVLVLEGNNEGVKKAFDLISSIKGEARVVPDS